ncbi:MAG: 50S ribosomal protein L23 [Chitinophagaceae bacterium]|jgi:large subunit ribosomal protein L23|nr:50S ribosomal protein L23 [Chitinophagaceae bacterium]
MRLAEILIKPILSEKSNQMQEKRGIYSFKVARKANKLEIKKAVESFYGVNVAEVRTLVVPSKSKSRMTKSGVISGRKPGYKKALVTVAEGETIDLYATL